MPDSKSRKLAGAYQSSAQSYQLKADRYNTFDSADITTTIINNTYIDGIVDSDYVTTRAPAGIDSAQVTAITAPLVGTGVMSDSTGFVFITSSTTLTKKGDGNIYVRLAGGGGGWPGTNYKGGHSSGHGILNGVQDGATITITIGTGGGYRATGGTTTVTDGTQSLSMPGGGGIANVTYSNNGIPRDNVTASGGATNLNPGRGTAGYSFGERMLFIPGYGQGVISGNGTDGAVILWGV